MCRSVEIVHMPDRVQVPYRLDAIAHIDRRHVASSHAAVAPCVVPPCLCAIARRMSSSDVLKHH